MRGHHFPLFKILNFFSRSMSNPNIIKQIHSSGDFQDFDFPEGAGDSSMYLYAVYCFSLPLQTIGNVSLFYILLTESRVKSSEIREEDVSFSRSRSRSLHPRGYPQFIKVEPSPLCPPSSGAKTLLCHVDFQETCVFLYRLSPFTSLILPCVS